ncbi:uncharacterized protein ARMOST_01342 [Armillaria ostoyae]|uniref:Uncharacterized protein n=1 Tax=Armillaria ostoyae TaxID=47428 RepID=A0A284QNN8_ARMOS|nr:uncharacterized protein ARMOST_01342 [Armillaria ostoyae]
MDDIKLYLKSRPAHPNFGDRPWILLKRDFPYGPFCSAWGSIPPDATEVYTLHSRSLTAGLTKLQEILPKLREANTEIPRIQASASTSPFRASFWDGFQTIRPAQDLLADCRYQTVKLVFGDRTPPKPSRKHNNLVHSPEFWKLVGETTFPLNRDVELVDLDIDLQRLLWTTIFLVIQQGLKPIIRLWEEVSHNIEEITWRSVAGVGNYLSSFWVRDKHQSPQVQVSTSTSSESTASTSTTSSASDNQEQSTPNTLVSFPGGRSIKPFLVSGKIKVD